MTVFKDWETYAKHGIFAVLFICLLAYQIRENQQRESEYRQIIQQQTDANAKLADLIKVDLTQIREKLAEGR